MSHTTNQLGEQILNDLDAIDDMSPDSTEFAEFNASDVPRRRHRHKYATYVATLARNRIPGLENKSAANKLVVRHFIFREMTEHGLRPSHIAATIDMAVMLAFVPNQYAYEARAIEATLPIMQRTSTTTELLYSRGNPTIFNWFGRKVKPTEYSRA
jgi:hypothetical protein